MSLRAVVADILHRMGLQQVQGGGAYSKVGLGAEIAKALHRCRQGKQREGGGRARKR